MPRSTFAIALLPLLTLACGQEAIQPTAPAPVFDLGEASNVTVSALVVRAAEGSSSTMFGVLHVWLATPPNPVLPPSPVVPPNPVCPLPILQDPGELLLCGTLRNPGGETLESAELTIVMDGLTEVVRINFTPPSPIEPCETVFLQATAPISLVGISPGPPNITALLITNVGLLVGVSPGASEQPPGPPNSPSCVLTRDVR